MKQSHCTRAQWGHGRHVKSSLLPRSGAEWHARDGRGRGPASSASQRQHGRLRETDGEPGLDGLTGAPTPSSPPEGKSIRDRPLGYVILLSTKGRSRLPGIRLFTLD